MYSMSNKACVVIRHPTLIEGQTVMTRNFLKVLKQIYGKELWVYEIDGGNNLRTYLVEGARVLNAKFYDSIHFLNTNKVIPRAVSQLINSPEVIVYQFAYLPAIHKRTWIIHKVVMERGSGLIVGTSRRIANLFRNSIFTYPPVDVKILNPMNRIAARSLLGIKFDGPIIGYVGDIDRARGVEELLTACKRLVERGRRLKILVASLRYECKDDHVLRLMAKLIKDRALIPLFRPISINLVMNAIDVFAIPMTVDYSTEPPMAFIEALSSGVPIVAGPSPSLLDYRGMYLMVSDGDSLVEELDKALEGEYKELGERNRDFVLRNMSVEAVAERLKDIFDGLC